ncbi:MAG: ATP-binding protein, partial [Candidatus Binatia bacterium]
MTWTLGPEISAGLLEHWEATLNKIFVPGSHGRIICQYNRSRLSAEVLFAALHTHPLAILDDHIYPNVFYAAPSILDGSGNGNPAAARVDWMIAQLKRARSAQKQREESIEQSAALAQSEVSKKKIENILSVMPVAVYTCDAEGRITYFNQRAAEIWGREPCLDDTEEKFCGSCRLTYADGSLLALNETPMARAIRTGECTRDQEVTIERPDGLRVVASVNIDPMLDAYGRFCGAINAFQDVTARKQTETELRQAKEDLAGINAKLELRVQERTAALERAHAALLCEVEEQRNLEEQLRHAQKMESVGTLAGGIAHDFNNILNIIRGYSSLIQRHAPEDGTIREGVRVIEEEIERGAAVVRQLLTVARKTEAQLALININDAVSQLSNLLKQTLPKTIEVILDLDPAVPRLLADANQVNQALLNICVNARDAMPNGGRVTLSTRVAGKKNIAEGYGPAKAEQYVCIEVMDTGFGMDASIRNRIFEPFFTTKGIGQGTGWGLAMAYAIVKDHEGFITVESEPGHGATFRLYFPVVSTAQTTSMTPVMGIESSEQRKSAAPTGTILVAEDEAPMA